MTSDFNPNSNPNREKIISASVGIALLLLTFLLLYQPWHLGERELFRQEGFYAVQAVEMDLQMPLTTAHGVAIQNAFPLYPLLGSLLDRVLPLPLAFNLRLLSVLLTAASAVLVYFTVRGARSHTAAQAATAMFIAVNLVIEKSLDVSPLPLAMFGLLAAQLLWFQGARWGNWDFAWVLSLIVLGLSFYAGGFIVLLYFFFPLIFMRRPLTLWPKLRRPGLWIGLLFVAGIIFLWGIPYLVLSRIVPLEYFQFNDSGFRRYLQHLGEFPFYALIRFSPWFLIAWAPFCVALQQLDDTPIFSRYLRTVVISSFFLLWFLPGTEAGDLLILAGPLSILTGLHYEAAVRRYSIPIRFFMKLCGSFVLLAAILLVLFCLLPEGWLDNFVSLSLSVRYKNSGFYLAYAAAATILMAGLGFYVLRFYRQRPVWLLLLLTCAGIAIFYWTAMFPYRAQDRSKSEMGRMLHQALADGGARPDELIYKSDKLELYAESLYSEYRIRQIASLEELPESPRVVFLLSTEFPQLPERNWTNLLPPEQSVRSSRNRLRLWKGVMRSDPALPPPEVEAEEP